MKGFEFRPIIFNAAQSGNLNRIKVFLRCERSPEWIESCLNSSENDKIPLVAAARHGFVDIVRYLLSKGADPKVTGIVSFDGENIYGTPPLWAASAAGHLEVVKVLVEEAHACVNQPTSTHSTALRGACYDGHLEIVTYLADHGADLNVPNRHGHTSLMIAAFRNKIEVVKFLISRGVDVSVQTSKGNSALHDAAEGGNVEVVKILLAAGARLLPDSNGLCPLITSAMCGNSEVVDVLLDYTEDNLKKRDALKLLGCTMVDKKLDVSNGMDAWKRAVEISLTDEEWKRVFEMKAYYEPVDVYDKNLEVHSISDVVAMENNLDLIRMQSLLLRERILGGSHSEVQYCLRFRGAVYCDLGRKDRCFDLWKRALALQQKFISPLHASTVSTLQSFQETFFISLNEHVMHTNGETPFQFDNSLLEHVYDRLCFELERLIDWGDAPFSEECCEEHPTDVVGEKQKLVIIGLQLMHFNNRLALPSASFDDGDLIESVKLDIPRLLHICRKLQIPILHLALQDSDRQGRFPSTAVIERLLTASVDVDEVDEEGNSPVHVLLANDVHRLRLIELLLEHGSHLFARNAEGKVVAESIRDLNLLVSTNERVVIGRFFTLKGLAAQAIRRHNISHDYALTVVPAVLARFLQSH